MRIFDPIITGNLLKYEDAEAMRLAMTKTARVKSYKLSYCNYGSLMCSVNFIQVVMKYFLFLIIIPANYGLMF